VVDDNGDIQVLNTSDLSNITAILNAEFEGDSPVFIAISPNKSEGYVTTNAAKVYVFSTETNHVTGSFDLPTNAQSNQMAVTPNGAEVYVGDLITNQIFYISLSDSSVHTIIGMTGAEFTSGIAIAPDGTAAYAVQQGSSGAMLTKIDISTHTTVGFAIPAQLSAPQMIAITPDGKTACIADSGLAFPGQYVAFIDTATGSSSTLQLTTAQQQSNLLGIAITPDQAPTARFTPTVSGATVTFDASASSSPIGSIATYAWDFGDGQTATTTSPTTSHTYTTSGTFTVTLTVTNTAGTSTSLTFTGQTASNNGGPSAVTTQQITAQTTAIDSFKGKVHRNHKEKKVYLKTKWTKSLVPNTRKYEIFARNTKIATIKANHKRHKTLHLHPHHFPHKISKDYRHYLDHKYNIRVVDSLGRISQPTFVHVVKH
jgi:DNA-binding beta-propeller fold protein YncE